MFNGQFYPGQSFQFEGMQSRSPWHLASLQEVINRQGLTSGLKLCLDAGDAASYSSGQSWLDRSGNGYDFFRGTTSGAGSTDPTFNGTPGGLSASEYWSFDNTQLFTYDSGNETWMNNLHKDNALFTLVTWCYPTGSAVNGFWGTRGGSSNNIGADFNCATNTGNVTLAIANGSGTTALTANPNLGAVDDQWQFFAASMDEAGGTLTLVRNGTASTASASYSSPSASNASFTAQIGASGGGAATINNGGRMAMFAAWEGVALSNDQIQSIFVATRARFGV
jgi:hypothetical protein